MTVVANGPVDGERHASLTPGEVLAGRYRIAAFLGHGAVGEVYEAFDQELGEAVAVKVLIPEIARDERVLQRFKREIQLARRVTHPNVCRVFDLAYHTAAAGPGAPPEKVLLTMELLRGETLEQLLARQGRMTTAEALPVIGHIVAALAAAHANGVVHRDLKSGNIFLVPSPSGTRAVVTDFGLAWSSIEAGDDANLTATGELVGSPAYMAPEQVRGEEATPATDVYALGVVLFEMVTGELPFVGKSAFYTALKRLQEPAPSPRLHLSDLDPAWERTILRCLEREPEKRFPSVRHVLRALGLTRAEEDATSPLRLVESHVRRLRRRRRRVLELAAVAAVLAACGLWWALQTGRIGHRAATAQTATAGRPVAAIPMRPVVAVLPFDSLSPGAGDAQSRVLFELLPLELAASGKVRAVPAEEVDRALLEHAALPRLGERLSADFLVTGAYLPGPAGTRWDVVLRDHGGHTVKAFSESGDAALERLADGLRQAVGAGALTAADAQALDGLRPTPEAALLWAEALHRQRRGETPAARDLLRRAVAADADNPLLRSALAAAWADLGYDGEAQKEAKQALALAAMLRREDRLALEARYHELAQEWSEAAAQWQEIAAAWPDDLEAGLRQARAETAAGHPAEAAATLVRLHRLPSPAGVDPRLDLAEANAAAARLDPRAARDAAVRAARRAEALGALRVAAQARLEEAGALLSLHDLAEARRAVDEARRSFTAAGDAAGGADADRGLAKIRYQAGDLAGASAAYAEAVTAYQHLGAEGNAALALRETGNMYYGAGDLDQAEAYYRRGRILSAAVGDRRGEAKNLHNMANINLQRGRLSEARDLYRQTLALHRELGFLQGEAATLQGLGNVAFAEGDLLSARGSFQQALAIYRRGGAGGGEAAAVLNNLAEVSLKLGDLAQSRQERESARGLALAAHQEDGVARADRGIADVVRQQGDAAAARALYERSLATYERLKLPAKQTEMLDEIGVTLTLQGDLVEALKRFQQALDITHQRHDHGAEAQILMHQGRTLWRWGELTQAAAALQRALGTLRELQKEYDVAEALVTLGCVQLDQGDLTAARHSFGEALASYRQRGARGGVASALAGLGALDLAQGEPAQARKRYGEALAIRTAVGEKLGAAQSRLALAEVTLAEKRPAQAETDARAAATDFQALANPPGQCAAALLLARCLLAQNKTAEAAQVLAGAAQLLDASQEPAVRKAAAELRGRAAVVPPPPPSAPF
ncbi:MAG TPA: tetratricopeptide repeat protein [Thermoanaerobaculia bacterium]|jgi:tetratricopeptide (TPR) repeat protein/tRNA A-37 threonylcarbamoyl transferase component Bud32|nr:tetratricopeptide repeat protein [Thermoanaerobaculia bacterium]